jgi:hypothetical protein
MNAILPKKGALAQESGRRRDAFDCHTFPIGNDAPTSPRTSTASISGVILSGVDRVAINAVEGSAVALKVAAAPKFLHWRQHTNDLHRHALRPSKALSS